MSVRLEATEDHTPLGLLVGGASGVGLGLVVAWRAAGGSLPACPLHAALGVPCPSCGGTRMIDALVAGDVGAALAWNPLLFVLGLALGAWALASAWRAACGLAAVRLVLAPRDGWLVRVVAVVAVGGNWAWLVWRGV